MTVQTFRLNRRNNYSLYFLAVTILAIAGLVWLWKSELVSHEEVIKLAVPAIAAVAGLVYFLYSQHLQETRLFVELFREFNERYDKLNGMLNSIASDTEEAMLTPRQKHVLFDYFNLCAEEWLYYKTGYIDPTVWDSWREGMKYFLRTPEIKRLLNDELRSGSYYGLTMEAIEK